MRKTLIGLILLTALTCALIADGDARNVRPQGMILNTYSAPEIDHTHSFAPLDIDSIPPFPEFHGQTQFNAGDSWYDMQHNSTKGRNIAVDPTGGVHVSWTDAIVPSLANRRVKYNYWHADSVEDWEDPTDGWFCGSDGVQVDARDYAGYTTISVDDAHTVPTVAYHDRGSGDYTSNAAFDGMYYATMGAERCAFMTPTTPPAPYYLPWDPTFHTANIWPVVAQIDTTVWLVSTSSNSNDTVAGRVVGDRLVYYRGFIKPVEGGWSDFTFEDPVEIEDDQIGITCDITAYDGGGRREVAMAYIRRDSMIVGDSCYCDIPLYYTTMLDAAAIMIRRSSDMGATWSVPDTITTPMAHVYSDYPESLYIGWTLDSTVTPPETVEVYRPCYSRPVDVNVTYSPSGVLHAVWGELVLAPHEGWETVCEAACSVGAYQLEVLCHWDEASGEIDTVTWDNYWLFRPPTDSRPADGFRYTQMGPSHEPVITVDNEENIFVFWEQRWSEYWWAEAGTLLIDNSLLGFPNSEIYCSVYDPDSGFWSDPLNISNTFTPACSTGECMSEIEVTTAERVDDYVHIAYIEDHCAGLHPYPEGSADGEGAMSLVNMKYVRFLADSLRFAAYESDTIGDGPNLVEENWNTTPRTFRLGRNYPNPFNAATSFFFDVRTPGDYKVSVVDVNGRTVSRIIDGRLEAGRKRYIWDGLSDNGWNVPSGVYFLNASDDSGNWVSRKIILIK